MTITIDRVIDEIRQLPEPLQREVLNFARFLKSKAARVDLDNLVNAQHSSMEAIWNNEDDEVWNDVPAQHQNRRSRKAKQHAT